MLGVCSALAVKLGVDVFIVRLLFLLFLMCSGGTAIVVYILLSFLL